MSFIEDVTARFQQKSDKSAFHQEAWAEFSRLGLPSRKSEAWKYSRLEPLLQKTWRASQGAPSVPSALIEMREFWRQRFDILIFLNGEVRLDASVLSDELRSYIKTGATHPQSFEDGFASLSAALSRPGVRLQIPAQQRVARPVLILRGQVGEGTWDPVHNQIMLAKGAELQLAEIFCGEGTYLRAELMQVYLQQGAHLNWLRWQREDTRASHFAEVRVQQEAGSLLHVTQLNSGAAWSRNSLRAEILGREAETHLNGLTFACGEQHVDQRVEVIHQAELTNSSQLFKNVLRDRSRGVLNGKIAIAQDAQKVSSSQYNHSLLIGQGAEADTKPELEIYADDVKANHGASIGRLDEDKIFYLLSRGIKPEAARAMLTRAFVDDVAMKVQVSNLRQALDRWLQEVAQ